VYKRQPLEMSVSRPDFSAVTSFPKWMPSNTRWKPRTRK
jgi:hypothetical protein